MGMPYLVASCMMFILCAMAWRFSCDDDNPIKSRENKDSKDSDFDEASYAAFLENETDRNHNGHDNDADSDKSIVSVVSGIRNGESV